MKTTVHLRRKPRQPSASVEDILILSDGKIMAHNLSPRMAALLSELSPNDKAMRRRSGAKTSESQHELRART